MLTNDRRRYSEVYKWISSFKISIYNYNKSLEDWSLGETVNFVSLNLYVSLDSWEAKLTVFQDQSHSHLTHIKLTNKHHPFVWCKSKKGVKSNAYNSTSNGNCKVCPFKDLVQQWYYQNNSNSFHKWYLRKKITNYGWTEVPWAALTIQGCDIIKPTKNWKQ